MATAKSLKDIEKHLECAVCLEQFQDPKVLLCLHTYCKKCLEKIKKKRGKRSVITCPECRMETEIPEEKLDSLPVNFFVNNLMSVVALLGESQTKSIECDSCDSGDAPKARCSVCSFFLCDFCAEGHRRGKRTKSHKLMSMEDVKSSGTINISRPSMCEEHEEEMLKLYCQTCEKAICRDCTMVEHRQHQYLFVKDAYSKEKEAILELLKKTKNKQDDLKQAIAKVSKARATVEVVASGVKQDINVWINQLIASLEQHRTELHQSLNEVLTSKVKELQIQQEQLEVAFSCVQSSIDFTERAFQDGSQVEVLEMKKPISERLTNLSGSTWKLEPCTCTTLYFIPDQSLGDGVQKVGSIRDCLACAAKSTVRIGGAKDGVMYNLVCGQTRVFHVQARNDYGGCCNVRADNISVEIKAPEGSVSRILELFENDPKGSGCYAFFYKPEAEGTYSMSVKIDGENVLGSPFTWQANCWRISEQVDSQGYSEGYGNIQLHRSPITTVKFFTVANATLNSGHFSWKIQIAGPLAIGIKEKNIHQYPQVEEEKRATYRFQGHHMSRSQRPAPQLASEKWLWNMEMLQSAFQAKACTKHFPALKNGDQLSFYLDLDHKRLVIEHLRTSALVTKDISDVVCPVSPLFRLDSPDSTVSLVEL